MSLVKKVVLSAAVMLSLFALCTAAYADEPVTVLLDGGRIAFDAEPVIVGDRVMVPMRAIFERLGASVYWDEDERSVISELDGTEIYLRVDDDEMLVNDKPYELDEAPFISSDRVLVPLRAVSEAFGCYVGWDPDYYVAIIRTAVEPNSVLGDVVVKDDERYLNYDGEYGGVSVFDKGESDYFGMELLAISPEKGEEFARIVNGMADDLPDTRVFCGIAPTAAEFYASDTYKTNYLSSISHIYNNLNDAVIPLNTEGAMNINLGNYLYFRTDHHWTHFGSYCAYLDFCDRSGNTAPGIEQFETETIDGYIGSWGSAVKGTAGYDMLSESPDSIVLYQPIVDYYGMSYKDMAFEQPIKEMVLLNENFGNYDIFLEGDYPIDHFHTDVGNGKSICVIKESYGNAFSTWLVNNYEDVYIVDYRQFNGHGETYQPFTVKDFYELHPFDDLLVLCYPYTIVADDLRQMFGEMWRQNYAEFGPENVD